MAGPLSGRVALVTGGGRGIGAAIGTILALDGAAVAVTYRRDVAAAEALVAGLRERGAVAVAVESDIADPASSERAVGQVVDELGGLDIVVNNAGIASSGRFVADTALDELTRLLAVHAIGPHQLIRAALPHLLLHDRSDVVFISSTSTIGYWAGGAPYAMGKAAVEALAHTLAKEQRDQGLRVNIVAPGLVATDMGARFARATQNADDIHDLDAASPFGRVCLPDDIARVVRFLVGPEGSYVNDQRIVVDGGMF
ncbi:Short-chain dehydrogenase/reductase SDR [metagenome]|uniref:Short-chain dehydrogenase/reductase SDR n=1 Tax=metagenome TaxID=256318 RepID=A0A2P2C445_9ZZZZ